MAGVVRWIRGLYRELRRRQVIRVAVVYATTAFVILQLGEILVEPFGLGDWALRLVLFLLVLGFPLSIGLAWVYNVTAEGVVREVGEELAGDEAVPAGTHEESPLTSNGLIVGLLILVVGLLVYPRVFSSGEPSSAGEPAGADPAQVDDRSIAVLPFENMGGEESAQFTKGVHDDLLTRLSNVSALKVISRTSVEKYRDTGLSLPAIADSLGAKWVVEGGVQEAGGQIRVNAQLIDPETDVHRWANSYQRTFSAADLFAIQGEIAQEIAGALKAELTAGEQDRLTGAPTEDLSAYRLYVRGRHSLARRRFGDDNHVVRAATLFRRAIEKDPSFALAWAGLADARARELPDSLNLPDVSQKEAARRALELDPDLAEAHAAMGHAYLREGNGPAAAGELKRAIELKPSYWEAHHLLGVFHLKTGRVHEALDHLQLAVELNPQHAKARHGLYDAYLAAGQAKKSLKEARKQQRLGLEKTSAVAGEVRALFGLGQLEDARRLAEEQVAELGVETGWGGWFRAYLVDIHAAGGDTTQAQRYLRQLQDAEVWPARLAHAYAALGKTDRALDTYQRLTDEGWRAFGSSVEFRYGIMYDLEPLREDPRYEELIRKANRAWGLNPDGTIPAESPAPTEPQADA